MDVESYFEFCLTLNLLRHWRSIWGSGSSHGLVLLHIEAMLLWIPFSLHAVREQTRVFPQVPGFWTLHPWQDFSYFSLGAMALCQIFPRLLQYSRTGFSTVSRLDWRSLETHFALLVTTPPLCGYDSSWIFEEYTCCLDFTIARSKFVVSITLQLLWEATEDFSAPSVLMIMFRKENFFSLVFARPSS